MVSSRSVNEPLQYTFPPPTISLSSVLISPNLSGERNKTVVMRRKRGEEERAGQTWFSPISSFSGCLRLRSTKRWGRGKAGRRKKDGGGKRGGVLIRSRKSTFLYHCFIESKRVKSWQGSLLPSPRKLHFYWTFHKIFFSLSAATARKVCWLTS